MQEKNPRNPEFYFSLFPLIPFAIVRLYFVLLFYFFFYIFLYLYLSEHSFLVTFKQNSL